MTRQGVGGSDRGAGSQRARRRASARNTSDLGPPLEPVTTRLCDTCGTPIAAGRRSDARFCGIACRNAARGTLARRPKPVLPGDGARLRSRAQLEAAAASYAAAQAAGDTTTVLAHEAVLLDGELRDFLAALARLATTQTPEGDQP